MNSRLFLTVILILLLQVISRSADAAAGTVAIKIYGSSNVVDISDITERQGAALSEIELKRICAKITERYHYKGYTSFYIKRAVLNSDGTADLFFAESVVSEVVVTGTDYPNDEIAGSIFIRGNLFNEFLLRDNISETKKKFNLKQLNVSIRRNSEGDIVLNACAVEKINEIESEIYNSSAYGISPELTYRINYAGFLAGISASSSFHQKERSFSSGHVFLNTDNVTGNSYFTIQADFSERKDSFSDYEDIIYRHRSFSGAGGYCSYIGEVSVALFLSGTVDKLMDYPGTDGGVSFVGYQLKLGYDNSQFKIEYNDITSGEINYSSGWNFAEERFTSKLALEYLVNFPVYSRFFLSVNGSFTYISDHERYSYFYVYDRFLPCRGDDFSSAPWRNVTGGDLVYEAMAGTLYFASGFRWGLYKTDGSGKNIYAPGVKLFYKSGKVKVETSYMFDMDYNFKDGFLMFSVSAVY